MLFANLLSLLLLLLLCTSDIFSRHPTPPPPPKKAFSYIYQPAYRSYFTQAFILMSNSLLHLSALILLIFSGLIYRLKTFPGYCYDFQLLHQLYLHTYADESAFYAFLLLFMAFSLPDCRQLPCCVPSIQS